MVGMFINTLPVRVQHTPHHTTTQLLTTLQHHQSTLLDHHHHALADIQQHLGVNTLFDTLVVFESYPIDRAALTHATTTAGIHITGIRPYAGSHYPLTLTATAEPHLRLTLQYQQGVIDHHLAHQIAHRLTHILDQLTSNPELTLEEFDVPPVDGLRPRQMTATNDAAAPAHARTAYRAPQSTKEQALADLFAEVFGADRVGVDDTFFELGGNSLLAIKLVARIRGELGIDISIRTLFEAQTIAQLAARADAPAAVARPRLRRVTEEGRALE
ncbi:hypothetical protein KEF29_00670 [Streptomyces tuirus]|uniref:Carrier domain-containing protein n=1 Tax=Streptomyces tuirus TaxID=68278 RepID=A0A941J0B1_9ACTN|nr:hypothetical protein [Streptomyces tuirus]